MEGGARYDGRDLDNLEATELRLGPPGKDVQEAPAAAPMGNEERRLKRSQPDDDDRRETAPVAKAPIVGWPPVRANRMNSFRTRKAAEAADQQGDDNAAAAGAAVYVKVSMDGAPYLRKVDLRVYKGYKDLRGALGDMFTCFSLGASTEGYERSEYAITYEDRDGDWMLVGDVPWDMFISSCKRLRIMKGSEARGLYTSRP